MKSRRFLIILILFVVGINFTYASSDNARRINRSHIEDYKKSNKYDYDKVTEPPTRGAFLNFLISVLGFFAQGFGFIILLILGLGFLFLIFYFISKSDKVSVINDDELNDIVIEELNDLEHLDLDKMLHDALSNKNYRFATRILYLKILKSLNEKGIIEWKNEKTNYDYIKEVENVDLRKKLDRVTYLYEYVWYGELPLDKNKFQSIEPEFEMVVKGIVKK